MRWQVEVKYRSGMVTTTTWQDYPAALTDAGMAAADTDVFDHTESITLTPVTD